MRVHGVSSTELIVRVTSLNMQSKSDVSCLGGPSLWDSCWWVIVVAWVVGQRAAPAATTNQQHVDANSDIYDRSA